MANIVDTDALNQYDQETGTFTSSDSSSPGSWQSVAVLASGETKPSIFAKISKMFSNIRWLYSNKRTIGAFDSKNDTVTFTTEDVSSDNSATSWTTVSQLTSGLSHATLLNRISAMMKNVRYLYGSSYNDGDAFTWVSSSYIDTSKDKYISIQRVGRFRIVQGYFWLGASISAGRSSGALAKLNDLNKDYCVLNITNYYGAKTNDDIIIRASIVGTSVGTALDIVPWSQLNSGLQIQINMMYLSR